MTFAPFIIYCTQNVSPNYRYHELFREEIGNYHLTVVYHLLPPSAHTETLHTFVYKIDSVTKVTHTLASPFMMKMRGICGGCAVSTTITQVCVWLRCVTCTICTYYTFLSVAPFQPISFAMTGAPLGGSCPSCCCC